MRGRRYLYLIERTDGNECQVDTYIAAVVVATDEAAALAITPGEEAGGLPGWGDYDPGGAVKATLLGPCDRAVPKGKRVILASFNAG